jgi:hypothetical protein
MLFDVSSYCSAASEGYLLISDKVNGMTGVTVTSESLHLEDRCSLLFIHHAFCLNYALLLHNLAQFLFVVVSRGI